MSSQDYVRKEVLPLKWCSGCGAHVLFSSTTEVLDELNLKNTVVVSGIGCTGRGAGFFNLDSLHGMHGRAVPLAVGVKIGDEKLNVLVFSGDGDLLGIGGNHLIHAARRNDNITILCNRNEVFAMTGRQLAPTTKKGDITITSPEGSLYEPLNVQGIITSNKKYFYARTSPIFKDHLKKCVKEAMEHKGFSFVEVLSPCTLHIQKKGMNIKEAFSLIKENYKIKKEGDLKENELGIMRK